MSLENLYVTHLKLQPYLTSGARFSGNNRSESGLLVGGAFGTVDFGVI
jgi:hypothetical protein